MEFRLWAVVLTISLAPGLARAQSVISTILGVPPDGVQALSALLNMPAGVVADGSGNVYAALKSGHQVVRIDAGGTVWLVAGTGVQGSAGDGGPAKSATLSTPVALALDVAGNLYIADSQANRIRRVGLDGAITTFAGNGAGGSGGDGGLATDASLTGPTALAFDKSGNLLIADSGNQVIRRVTPNGVITTVAGNRTKGSQGNGGQALQASLNNPAGVITDNAGRIYISDYGNKWIRVVSTDGTISRYAGVASSTAAAGDTTIATNAVLYGPTSLAMDQAGSLYFVEYGAPRIRRITSQGKISSYAGTGVAGGSGDGGLARFANLNVVGIAMDGNNNLLIADGVNNRVRIVTVADGIIETIAGNGLSSYNPRGLALHGDTLYFSDAASNRVRAFDTTTGELSQVAGNGVASFWGDSGSALDASLASPRGLAFDQSGNLFIADSANNRVRRVTPGGIISTVAGTGVATSTGDGAAATAATLHEPVAVVADASGNLFIAERSGNRVRKVSASGVISTVAGTGAAGAPDAESGVAINQKLNLPQGLALDLTGDVLIADTGNNRIRRLSSDGTITTVAGSSVGGSSGDGGPATSATLMGPSATAVDAAGNLYIADTGNQKIRRVSTGGLMATVAGDGAAGYDGDGSPATAFSLNGPSALAAGAGSSMFIADTTNRRIRQFWPAVAYAIASNPPGLEVAVDGQVAATPLTVELLPGTSHRLDAPSPQSGPAGTRYVFPGAQTLNVACGPERASATLSFNTQYALTIGADRGGTVTSAAGWQDAGATVTLNATPQAGFIFAGWEGDCAGAGSCRLPMNGPRSVKADFSPAHVLNAAISVGGVVGAGLSTPPVKALSPNGIGIVFGSGFAPAGTLSVAGAANLVNGRVSTELDGVCVLVGSTPAPLLALTPTQINFQAPATLTPGTAPVQVVTGCGTAYEAWSGAEPVTAQSASPEFFYFVQGTSGQNPITAVNAGSGAYVGAPGLAPGVTFVPAKPGDALTLFATGLGLTDPAVEAGVLPAAASAIAGDFHIYVGSTELAATDVLYAGVAPSNAGLYQIDIRLPASTPDGDLPVRMTVNGIASATGGYITAKR